MRMRVRMGWGRTAADAAQQPHRRDADTDPRQALSNLKVIVLKSFFGLLSFLGTF